MASNIAEFIGLVVCIAFVWVLFYAGVVSGRIEQEQEHCKLFTQLTGVKTRWQDGCQYYHEKYWIDEKQYLEVVKNG